MILFIIVNAVFTIPLIASQDPDIISFIRFHVPLAVSLIPFHASSQSPVKTPFRKSITPLRTSNTSPIILITDFIASITVSPITFATSAITGIAFDTIQLIIGTKIFSQSSFKISINLPRKVWTFTNISPNSPSISSFILEAKPCITGRIYVLYPSIKVPKMVESPLAIESKKGFKCSSYNAVTKSERF